MQHARWRHASVGGYVPRYGMFVLRCASGAAYSGITLMVRSAAGRSRYSAFARRGAIAAATVVQSRMAAR